MLIHHSVLLAGFCGLALASTAGAQAYHIRDLGTPSGPSQAVGLNQSKAVAGFDIGFIEHSFPTREHVDVPRRRAARNCSCAP